MNIRTSFIRTLSLFKTLIIRTMFPDHDVPTLEHGVTRDAAIISRIGFLRI